jgi:hypothetical protein
MIKSNELRIGNFIYVAPVQPSSTVHKITGQDIADHANGKITLGLECAISLTAWRLVKSGFVKDRNGWHLPGTQFSLTEKFYPCWMDRMLWPQDISDFKHLSLQYVHQLQNLYFALTGEELKIKDPEYL